MHYQSRPTWRYQWSTVVTVLVLLSLMMLVSLYGPIYAGTRGTHLLFSAVLALVVYCVLLAAYRHLAWRYLIDGQAIESCQGVLARQVRSIRIGDLRNINVKQSVMQRLLDVGDVEFSSAAGGEVEVVFFGVAEPLQVKELVRRLQERPVE